MTTTPDTLETVTPHTPATNLDTTTNLTLFYRAGRAAAHLGRPFLAPQNAPWQEAQAWRLGYLPRPSAPPPA